MMHHLPVQHILPALMRSLQERRRVVLSAPPGAGKTTRVPLALLNEEWLRDKRIVMLEPRRLAARRAAEFMANQLGETVGSTVGYRIRGDAAVSSTTRIEVVTEGILTRMLHDDAALASYGIVVFDEFHERSIHADLGLALTLDVQDHLRDDLRLLVMSATLDGVALADFLADAAMIRSEGRSYPVETRYSQFSSDKPTEHRVADIIERAMENTEGDILVFLPGRREILRTESLLYDRRIGKDDAVVHLLFGEASASQQNAALVPDLQGRRKIILSTNVSETSLTIDGVRIVVDSGLARVARFEPTRGMTGLITVPVSRASADQRRGRAGRQAEGICYRLWTEHEHESLPAFTQPEIKTADLAHLALDLARWGDPEARSLRFMDPPPSAHLAQARSLLAELDALSADGSLNAHGRSMSVLPIHPRLAHMILRGSELGLGDLACDIAALLEERDILGGSRKDDIQLSSRLHDLKKNDRTASAARDRIRAQSERIRRMINIRSSSDDAADETQGLLLALAYPERIGKRKGPSGNRYQLANGTTGVIPESSPLIRSEYLALGDVDGSREEVKAFLAAPVEEAQLRNAFAGQIVTDQEVRWDAKQEIIVAREVERLHAIVLRQRPIVPEGTLVIAAAAEGVRTIGIHALEWTKEAVQFRQRSEWLRTSGNASEDWPDLSEERLMETLELWLGTALDCVRKRNDFAAIPLVQRLRGILSQQQQRELDRLAPATFCVPTGSVIAINYDGAQPVLAVRLQELFGQVESPRIAGGKIPLLLHLLSPASRPLAVTQDLRSFWTNTYQEIRTQMRARYPRHVWPEDPFREKPTKRVKKRM